MQLLCREYSVVILRRVELFTFKCDNEKNQQILMMWKIDKNDNFRIDAIPELNYFAMNNI